MSALQFYLILIVTCYTFNYEARAISAEELHGGISTMWETRFATLQSSVLSFQSRLQTTVLRVMTDMSYERQRRTLLEERVSDEKQKRTLVEEQLVALQKTLHNLTRGQSLFQDQVSDEKQKRTLLEERLDALQKIPHNSTFGQSLFQDQLFDQTKRRMLLEDQVGLLQEIVHDDRRGMSYEKQRRTQLEDELSHEKRNRALLEGRVSDETNKRTLLEERLSDETNKRTLLEERLSDETNKRTLLAERLSDDTNKRTLLEERLSDETNKRTLLEELLSHETNKRTLLEERLDALQAIVYNSTHDLFCEKQVRCLEDRVEMVKPDLATKFTDCWELQRRGGFTESGVYDIYPAPDHSRLRVRCDMTTDGGGWTVLQRRYDGSVNFEQTFEKYEKGFGDVSGEHWMGLEWIHGLTSQGSVQMRVDVCTFTGQVGYAVYGGFHVADRDDTYRLHAGKYMYKTGSSVDRLSYHNGLIFQATGRCARRFRGGWWYHSDCFTINLNGGHYNGDLGQGIMWWGFGGSGGDSLRSSEMKIRPLTADGEPSRPYICPPPPPPRPLAAVNSETRL